MKKVIGLLVCMGLICLDALAGSQAKPCAASVQTDTSRVLQTIKILGLRYTNFYTGSKLSTLDSNSLGALQQQSLAGVLANQSHIFIKSYGPGMLATAGFRGGNANHTAVIWNGFSLQNPISGQLDFSTIPSFLLEGIAIQYGSQAALFGSGNIGGTIHLQTQNNSKVSKLNVMLGMGSYGAKVAGIKYHLVGTNWQMQQKIFLDQTENNFAYKAVDALYPQVSAALKPSDLPTIRAENGQRNLLAWLQEFQFQRGLKHQLNVHTWLQKSDRHISPSVNAVNLHAQKIDETAKAMLEYKFKLQAYELQARYAFMLDGLSYKSDQLNETYSLSASSTAYLDQFYTKEKFQLQGSIMTLQTRAKLSESPDAWYQDKIALFGTFKYALFQHKLKQQLTLRQEWVNGAAIPLMPAYGVSYHLSPNIKLLGNIARSYRLPSFSDLYWPNMGNPNLQPEYGWNQEISITAEKYRHSKTIRGTISKNMVDASATLTWFNKNIHNWIIWLPAGGNLSKPMNVYQVWSRGAEFNWSFTLKSKKSSLEFGGEHDYTISTNQSSSLGNDASLFKQLIYTPRIKHQWHIHWQKGNYAVQFFNHYVGTRFVSSDHSNWLMPFSYSGLNVSKNWHGFNKQLKTQFFINNLFNQSYQVMVNQAMPLVNYQITLNLII
ncbi:MAG: TonB-dependent receptor [bacterium]|nr:TonB-dependent receptor [bacterium]